MIGALCALYQTPIPAEVETGGAGPAAVDDLAVDKKTEEKAESGQLAEEAEDEARLDVEKVVEKSSSQRPGLASQTPHLLPGDRTYRRIVGEVC